jgi:hypothetical protein
LIWVYDKIVAGMESEGGTLKRSLGVARHEADSTIAKPYGLDDATHKTQLEVRYTYLDQLGLLSRLRGGPRLG